MFIELNNMCGLDAQDLAKGRSILVTECGMCDGTFVLHHLLSMYLKGNNNVCLVGLLQSFTHYNNVSNKLSVNLTKCKEAKQFVFVEALKAVGEQIANEGSEGGPVLVQFTTNEDHGALRSLYNEIEKSVQGLENWDTKPTLLILDDVSVLLSLGIPVQTITYFVQYLRKLVCGNNGCVAVLCQHNTEGEDEDLMLLCQLLSYQSNLVFQVEGLKTGYCKDVHGEMTFTERQPGSASNQNKIKKAQFKIMDKNVKFFALGMSAAAIGY